jgi:hypothetical protein
MPRWVNRPEGSNWGDFGEDDQIGRMNLLTPERRRAAMAEVRDGIAFTLSLPLNVPTIPFAPFRQPPQLSAACDEEGGMFNRLDPDGEESTCDDRVLLYTQHSTQWDALSHRGRTFDADGDGIAELVYYNGFRAGDDVSGPIGHKGATYAHALGIDGGRSGPWRHGQPEGRLWRRKPRRHPRRPVPRNGRAAGGRAPRRLPADLHWF